MPPTIKRMLEMGLHCVSADTPTDSKYILAKAENQEYSRPGNGMKEMLEESIQSNNRLPI